MLVEVRRLLAPQFARSKCSGATFAELLDLLRNTFKNEKEMVGTVSPHSSRLRSSNHHHHQPTGIHAFKFAISFPPLATNGEIGEAIGSRQACQANYYKREWRDGVSTVRSVSFRSPPESDASFFIDMSF